MKKTRFNYPELLFDIAIAVLYIIIVTTLVIYTGKLREASNFQSEQYAERKLTDFTINYFFRDQADYDWLSETIKGIGVYNADGKPLRTYGETPRNLVDFSVESRVLVEYNKKSNTLEYIRAIPPLNLRNKHLFSPESPEDRSVPGPIPMLEDLRAYNYGMGSLYEGDEWYIFYVNIKDFWYEPGNRGRANTRLLIIVIPGLLACIILFTSILFHRFMASQRQLDEQKNLVLLGTAVRTISHEMKNPLGSIYLQIPLIDKLTEGAVRRETGIISREVERMNFLISWISDFIKEPVGETREIDLTEELAKARCRFPGEIHWHLPDNPVKTVMDPERFRTILDNLLNNAMESGSEYHKIHVTLTTTGNWVNLHVFDHGTGIPPENRKKIFDPFFTSKSRGSGVGLAVIKRFVDAAGGNISLNSDVGTGTEVTINLKRIK